MRAMLLGSMMLVGIAASTPAGAQSWTTAGIGSGTAFAGSSGVSARDGGTGHSLAIGGDHRRDHRDRRRTGGFGNGVVVGDWDREYQGDTLWRPDSFNDWWHERPNRAFPRWMQNNQNCERQWWGGGTWRC